jgi:hypothetical protein
MSGGKGMLNKLEKSDKRTYSMKSMEWKKGWKQQLSK